MKYIRISKREAVKRFSEDKPIYLCPCKFMPGGPWNQACLILGKEHLSNAIQYGRQKHPTLWKGDILSTAWDLMYNNWRHYNTSYEQGYYAHYYKEG